MPRGLTCTRREALLALGLAAAPDMARSLFAAVNRERARARLAPLVWDEALAAEARRHSRRMRELGFFSHEDPQRGILRRRLGESGIDWSTTGENLYECEGLANPIESAVQGWMNSPGHRRNILDAAFQRSGVGVSGNGRSYWFTQVFAGGRRRSVVR